MAQYEVDGTVYEFPDDMSDEQAQEILTKQGIIKGPSAAAPPSPIVPSAGSSEVGRAVGRVASNLNPIPMAEALMSPGATAKNMFGYTRGALDRMDQAQGLRKIAPALGAVPIAGPMLEQFAGDVQEGNIPEAIGDAVSMVLPFKIPRIARAATSAVRRTAPAVAETVGTATRGHGAGLMAGGGAVAGGTLGHMTGIPGAEAVGAAAGGRMGLALGRRMMKSAPEPPPLPEVPLAGEAPSAAEQLGKRFDEFFEQRQRPIPEVSGTPTQNAPKPRPQAPQPAPVQSTTAAASTTVTPVAEAKPIPFDRSKLPPDPVKGTPEYMRGLEALAARRRMPTVPIPMVEPTVSVPASAAEQLVQRVEHPPFAKTAPFSPSRAARQQKRFEPAPVSKSALDRLKDNPKALKAAAKLKKAMEK